MRIKSNSNYLLKHQCQLMKYPARPKVPWAPMQNGVRHMPIISIVMDRGDFVLQHILEDGLLEVWNWQLTINSCKLLGCLTICLSQNSVFEGSLDNVYTINLHILIEQSCQIKIMTARLMKS